jgi:hypothetical protein
MILTLSGSKCSPHGVGAGRSEAGEFDLAEAAGIHGFASVS